MIVDENSKIYVHISNDMPAINEFCEWLSEKGHFPVACPESLISGSIVEIWVDTYPEPNDGSVFHIKSLEGNRDEIIPGPDQSNGEEEFGMELLSEFTEYFNNKYPDTPLEGF